MLIFMYIAFVTHLFYKLYIKSHLLHNCILSEFTLPNKIKNYEELLFATWFTEKSEKCGYGQNSLQTIYLWKCRVKQENPIAPKA